MLDATTTPETALSPRDLADLAAFAGLARKFTNMPSDVRRLINDAGFHLSVANYYSAIPTVEEVYSSFEYKEPVPFPAETVFDHPHMMRHFDLLLPFVEEFRPPANSPQNDGLTFFWNNPMFTSCDAMAYYCMIRLLRPRRIVEVGAGFSTLVALEAVRANGRGEIIAIEPYPRDFLKRLDDITLLCSKVEDVPATYFEESLSDGDILFIDSTHTVKTGADCNYLYLNIVPNLTSDLMIHVHDIFLPWTYPREWLLERQQYWTEQYLVHAYLLDNSRAKVCFGTIYNAAMDPKRMEAFLGGKCPLSGSSLWFHRSARRTT